MHLWFQILENKKICDATSKSAAAISLVFIIFNTPWAVQQVITACTRTIVSAHFTINNPKNIYTTYNKNELFLGW